MMMRRIRRISLRDFRSYASFDLGLDGRSVAISGLNGSGKTNLLEALSMIGPGRGMRRATMADLARQGGGGGWGIGLSLSADDEIEPVTLSAEANPPLPLRRQTRIDGEPVPSAAAFQDYVRFLWATPAQDRLFLDSPGDRRRFLDRMTLTQNPAHAQNWTAYETAMRQRQAAMAEGRADPRLLSVLEQQMATHGVAVAASRRDTVRHLSSGYEALRSGAFPAASLALSGVLEEALEEGAGAEIESRYLGQLSGLRRRDAEVGRATLGPHRTDLLVTHVAKDQPARLCSTGEQKALLIGLILAHAAAMQAQDQAPLVLLLDEIAAHLDEERRAALAEILTTLGCQTFMTGTDAALFEAWQGEAMRVQIQEGRAVPLDG